MKHVISLVNALSWIGAIIFVIIPMIDITSADSPLHGEALAQECVAICIKFVIFAALIGITGVAKSMFKKK